jgi:O-antigen/teichoic acid export membrane protein
MIFFIYRLNKKYKIITNNDIFILLYFLNAAAVGIYSIGVTIAQILWYVSNSINSVLFPHLTFTSSGQEKYGEWKDGKKVRWIGRGEQD